MNPTPIKASMYTTGVRTVKALSVAAAGLALGAGCDRDDGSKPPPPPPTVAATTVPTTRGTVPATATAPTSGGGIPASAEEARQRAAASEGNAKAAATQGAAQTQAAATAQMTSEEANKLLDQATAYVKENKYELADKTLSQLEASKASLPQAIQDRLANARSALNAAKAGNGLQIPGLGGGK